MKILVIGATGMLGHQLLASLASRHEVTGTVRGRLDANTRLLLAEGARLESGVDARRIETVESVLMRVTPDAVVNATGVVKQVVDATDDREVLETNAVFPRRLADLCSTAGIRVVHVSTDCVFSGSRGMYTESDTPDATDLYGRSKLEGELTGAGCITLRTSMIGMQLNSDSSLVEWFLKQRGTIQGYRRAIFSGFTTAELARVIERILVDYPEKFGLYHVSSEPIDKYTLLCGLRDRLGLDIEILAYDDFECDRSLDSTRFRTEFDYTPPCWDDMLDELSKEIRERDR